MVMGWKDFAVHAGVQVSQTKEPNENVLQFDSFEKRIMSYRQKWINL